MNSKSTTPREAEAEADADVADDAATSAHIDLDAILVEIGESGADRLRNWLLWSAIVLFATLPYMSYVFTAGQQDYRCAVPQCEPLRDDAVAADFGGAAWLRNAMPLAADGRPVRCERYRWLGDGDDVAGGDAVKCGAASSFNRSHVERCDRFVYDGDEVTIVKEVCIITV